MKNGKKKNGKLAIEYPFIIFLSSLIFDIGVFLLVQ